LISKSEAVAVSIQSVQQVIYLRFEDGQICNDDYSLVLAMTFEEYLTSKKIDSSAFKAAEPARWKEWNDLFDQVSEQSFTSQKLYLINPTRRKYLLKTEPPAPPPASTTPKPVRPVMKPKIQ
jgi:hypothetical protein